MVAHLANLGMPQPRKDILSAGELVDENDSCVSASGETETRVPEGSPRKWKMLQILGIGHGVPGTR